MSKYTVCDLISGCGTAHAHMYCCPETKSKVRPKKKYARLGELSPEEVVQVYGFCIRTLRLPVISVMIIGVMRLSYNERTVPDGRVRHHLILFQAVFVRTT